MKTFSTGDLRLIKTFSTEELIAELKERGLGVFNLSLPFNYRPRDETKD